MKNLLSNLLETDPNTIIDVKESLNKRKNLLNELGILNGVNIHWDHLEKVIIAKLEKL